MENKSRMLTFTRTQIDKAFKKTKETYTGINGGTLVLVTESMYDQVIKFLRYNFVPYEPSMVALGLNIDSQDVDVLLRPSLKFNMSLAVQDSITMEIIGALIICVANYDDEFDLTVFKDDGLRSFAELVNYVRKKGNVFRFYYIKEVIAFKKGAVSINYRRQGILHFLVQSAKEFVKNLQVYPIYITVEGSSNFSKKVIEKNGFEAIYNFKFEEYTKDGRQVLDDTGMHKSVTVYGQCISVPYSKL